MLLCVMRVSIRLLFRKCLVFTLRTSWNDEAIITLLKVIPIISRVRAVRTAEGIALNFLGTL